ncbi:MAG TPA: hypothetical protein VN631_13655 [Negativicutes bacterium]|nr:hypothetical protein [Negativicutes bacterium]
MEGSPEHTPQLEQGENVFICPLIPANGSLYRIGVVAKVVDIRRQLVDIAGHEPVPFLSMLIEGIAHARWDTLSTDSGFVMAEGLDIQDFRRMRNEYPVVSGAGWVPQGGFTEFRSLGDIPVTVYGSDIERNVAVSLTGNLKGLVSLEAAHTIEHAMIRSLRTYGLCTVRTLQEAMRAETDELTWSVEKSMRYAMPEVLGNTHAGACGNPMTNMAQFYMVQELTEQLGESGGGDYELGQVRRTVMSRLTGDLGLTTEPGLRALQGLKKGMRHDDSPLSQELCKKILGRFPLGPWQ